MTDIAEPLDLMADRLLPVHPTLCHPRTGEPLRAVGVIAGRTVWPMLGASDDDGDGDDGDDSDDDSNDDGDDGDDDSDDDDDKPLGPKGERALAAEKEKRRKANEGRQREKKRADDLQAELDRLKGKSKRRADKNGKDDDDSDDDDRGDDRRDAETEKRANAKIVRAEAKSLAADTFINADDAHRYLDLSKYEVDDNGDVVDIDDLKDDLAEVLDKNPHLAKKKRRVQGDGDGGQRGNGKKPDPGPGRARMRDAYGTKK